MSQQTTDRARFDAWFAGLQDAGADFAWEAWQAAAAAERERCAMLCSNWTREHVVDACCDEALDFTCKILAATIRSQP